MPKWVVRLSAVAVAGVGLMGVTTAARATVPAVPTVSMGAAITAVTLPAGCSANSVKVASRPDGTYHGYAQATCDSKGRLFHVARSSSGRWSLAGTAIDMPIPYAIAVDNTGTYFVGKRSNHDLVLVRRNTNGSLSTVHVLEKYQADPPISVEHASVVATEGNYLAVWDDNEYEAGLTDHWVREARTIPPAFAPRTVGGAQWYNPVVVNRPGEPAQLLGCALSGDERVDNPTSSALTAISTGTNWSQVQHFPADSCVAVGRTSQSTVSAFVDGQTYFSHSGSGGIYDDRFGDIRFTALSGSSTPEAILAVTGARVAFLSASPTGAEQEWLQNFDGSFNSAPTGVLSAAPVPVHQDQIIIRTGKLIRIFIQDDGHHHGGRRLLEQIQS